MFGSFSVKLLGSVLFCLFLLSCSPKLTNPLRYEGDKISFGTGGGFAGLESRYLILDNGNLYQHNRETETFVRLKKADRNRVVQVFETYKMLNFTEIELNDPGNLYYFLDYQGVQGAKNKIVWGNGQVDQHVKLVYQILSQIVKESSEK